MAKKTAAKKKTKKAPKGKKKSFKDKIREKVLEIRDRSPHLKGKTDDEAMGEFQKCLDDEMEEFPPERHPRRTEFVYWKRAFGRMRNKYKRRLRSQATPFVGKVMGWKTPRDMMGKIIAAQLDLAKTNLTKALNEGLIMYTTSEDPDTGEKVRTPVKDQFGQYIPRDARERFKKINPETGQPWDNRNYGKELQHSWQFDCWLVCTPEEGEPDIRFATMSVSGIKATPGEFQLIPPVGSNVRFLALDRTPQEEEEVYVLRNSAQTEFEVLPDESLEATIADLWHADPDKIKGLHELCWEVDELEECFEEHGTMADGTVNWDLVVLTRGDVVDVSVTDTRSGNKWFRLERTTVDDDEDSLDELDTGFGDEDWDPEEDEIPDSTQTWVGQELHEYMDFGRNSVVYVLGRPVKMPMRNEDGELMKDDDGNVILGPVSISAYGVWADPDYKSVIEKEKVEESSADIDDDTVDPDEEYEGEEDEEDEGEW